MPESPTPIPESPAPDIPAPVPPVPEPPKRRFLEIELVNTDVKNEDGTNRQLILRSFDNLDPPFDRHSIESGSVYASFREAQRQGKRVYDVYLNDFQIGNIPDYLTQYIYDNIEICKGITNIVTFGGEKCKKYDATITLLFEGEISYLFASVKVVGVTFDNEDGVSRQSLLRKLHFHDSPFDGRADIELKGYEFQGQPAYGVYANGMQIGNIPADLIPFLQENIDCIESVSNIDVYGGGQRDGKPISYGCKITLRFLKNRPPVNVPNTLKITED